MANTLGVVYEQLAEQYLQQQGLKTVARNFSTKLGELDLVMRQQDQLIFVEVKYRASEAYGGASAAISYRQQQKLLRTAQLYLQRSRHQGPCRFDVLTISGSEPYQFNWIQNAIMAS
ncbi:YraN family protein [Alkalimonas sp. MEB108]|uniref:UPF0102 protein QWY20_05225 n=1 Tax=Alkalimonas cellulosilytica TaxID=3058395 RepID=A0ABU7J481_9GAMM|nr:YraN family protein [Alkalimonas sp. MEB108]MEE2000847.1 YraN family protein [Alkalimonas sp. MEB108]